MKLRPKESPDLWPANTVELWSVSSLSASPYNAREHTEADIDAVAASMKRWGVTAPALVDEAGVIIYGHCRVLAAKKNGFETYPVVVARGWTEAAKRAYCIADNQLAARATWDSETLANELAFLKTDGFELGLLGFDAIDLKDLLQPLGGELIGNPEDVPEPPEAPVTRPGDVWLLGRHRVCCGDCTQPALVVAAFGDLTPMLMVTDPPYGVDYDPAWRCEPGRGGRHSLGKVLNDDRVDWRAAWAHFRGDAAYVWHGGLHGGQVADSLISSGLEPRAQIVWAKPHFVLSRGDYHWQHETCWYAVRKGAGSHWNGDRKQSTVWEIANNSAGNPDRETTWGHGTQKPLECMRRPIENNSARGDVIYDPFLGSGTTLIAAEMTDRICVGLELSPAYVDVIVRRWESVTGYSAVLQATGREFQAVAMARSEEIPTPAEEDASISDCGGGNVSRAT